MTEATRLRRTRVWDLPTRLFHWALALSVLGLVATGKIGGALLEIHAKLGYLVLVLLLFRLLWGVVGGRWSRFSQFVPSPARLWAYVRGRLAVPVGHNPMGACSVLLMLALLLAQVATGLIINDEIAFTGPLYPLAPEAWVGRATHYHHGVGQGLILAMVVLHLLAIAWHLRRHNPQLVQAMISGDQAADATTPATLDSLGTRLLALLLLLCCAAAVAALLALA